MNGGKGRSETRRAATERVAALVRAKLDSGSRTFPGGFALLALTSEEKSSHAFSESQRDCRIVADWAHHGFAHLVHRIENAFAYIVELGADVFACLIDDGLDTQHLFARDLRGVAKAVGNGFEII